MGWGTHRFVEAGRGHGLGAGLGLISWSVLRQVCEPSRYCEPLAWCQQQQPASRLDLRGGTTESSRPSRKNRFAIICYHQFSTHSSRGGRRTSSVGRPNSRCHRDRRPSHIRPQVVEHVGWVRAAIATQSLVLNVGLSGIAASFFFFFFFF